MPLTKSQAAESSPNTPKFAFTVTETAAALSVAPASVYRLVDRGVQKPSRALLCMRVTPTEIQRFLSETK